MIKNVRIKNYKSIKDSGDIHFTDKVFVLAGQNESGKSSVLEALSTFEEEEFDDDTLNFEEKQANNFEQEISCSYSVDNDDFFDDLISNIKEEFSIASENFIDVVKLKKISSYTITKTFDHKSETLEVSVSKPIFDLFKASIISRDVLDVADGLMKKTPFLEVDGREEDVAKIFFSISPKIILFSTDSLLPDKITIADLENKNTKAKGYNAVRNLEKLLNKDFVSISKLSVVHKSSATSIEVENLSDKFQKAWKQRIYDEGDLRIGFIIEIEDVAGLPVPTVFFSVETKDNVLLEPRKRSKGMIWFLSAWLDLKAREDGHNLVILYDEPGLYLHVKAHKDILELFAELVKKNHQVVYSTHSPSLINTETLHNIGLVLNTKDAGTIVEGLTTSKINTVYKQDALQPVAEAMGLEPLKDFSVLSRKNVLVEGLSDFWYFQSMVRLCGKEVDYKFVPGIGIKGNKINHLISFCIGYGLEWLLLMDNGANPQATRNELQKDLFGDDEKETSKKIKLLPFSELEDIFTVSDLRLVDEKIKSTDARKPSAIIGKNNKIIFARSFAQKVSNETIKKANIKPATLKNFEEVLKWIDEQFTK